jgi:hypothetical protein
MSATDTAEIALVVVSAIGGGGLIVFGLSSFLGKVWADRLMLKQSAEHDRSLQELRTRLERNANADLELLRRQLEITTTTHLRETTDKLTIYRAVVDLVADVLGDFDQFSRQGAPLPDGLQRLDRFNRQRLKIYGYMAMLAPQSVMDAYDSLADHLLLVATGKKSYIWTEVRSLALCVLNEVRADVGLDKTPIQYKGVA